MNANDRASLTVTDKMRRQIAGAVAEIDLTQIAITRRMTSAERVQQAASLIEAAERVGVYRLRQLRPT
jgi:DNA-binding MurR/RpiR family transcriptional regulator